MGSWKLGQATSRFELELDMHQPYILRRHKNADTFYDRICLALSPDRLKFRGIGVDQIGYYLVCGRVKDNTRIYGSVNYFNKFVIKFDGKRNAITGEYEGDWSIKDGGQGKFNLKREATGPATAPGEFFMYAPAPQQQFVPQASYYAPQAPQFAPQAPQYQYAPQHPVPHPQPQGLGNQAGYAPSQQPAPFTYINLNPQQPQHPHNANYPVSPPTPFDNN